MSEHVYEEEKEDEMKKEANHDLIDVTSREIDMDRDETGTGTDMNSKSLYPHILE
jgi:hypothetical protein